MNRMDELRESLSALSDEEKIARLFGIIDEEKDKPEDQTDVELIEACTEYVSELLGCGADASGERPEPSRTPRRLMAERHGRLRGRFRMQHTLSAFVAVIMVCVFCVGAFAFPKEEESFSDFFSNLIRDMQPGESIDIDGVTYTRIGHSKSYRSIDALAKDNENLDIYYPAELPGNTRIDSIFMDIGFAEENKGSLSYVFTDHSVSFSIDYDIEEDLSKYDYASFETVCGTFYTMEIQTSDLKYHYQAVCQTEKYRYCVLADDIKSLEIILKGLKHI